MKEKKLAEIFGSSAKLRILRLFMFNTEEKFTLEDVSLKTKLPKAKSKKEVLLLNKIGLLKTVRNAKEK